MPAQTRRVVVLSTEAFERLCASKAKEGEPPVEEEEEVAEEELKEVTVHSEPPADCAFSEATDTTEPAHKEPVVVVEEPATQVDPLSGFPPRYLKAAETTLARLRDVTELSWDCQTGCLSVGEQRLSISVAQLLRAICVPFTKVRVPEICCQLLNRYDIKPRNHLLVTTRQPKWRVYFKF